MLTMVIKVCSGFKHVGYYCVILLCIKQSLGFSNITKRQTDSFVVSANYDVQSASSNNPTHPSGTHENWHSHQNSTIQPQNLHAKSYAHAPSTFSYPADEVLPDPSAWRGSNSQSFASSPYETYGRHLQNDPAIFVSNPYGVQPETRSTQYPDPQESHSYGLGDFRSFKQNVQTNHAATPSEGAVDIVYGTIDSSTPSTGLYKVNRQQSHERIDDIHTGYELNEIFSDTHKPTVQDLQQIIGKIVKGATKLHQVVKVPAVYEIHLQEEEAKPPHEDPKNFQVPLPQWSYSPHQGPGSERYSANSVGWQKNKSWRKPQYNRASRHQPTRTWNLPTKIQYFNRKPVNVGSVETSKPINGKYSFPRPFTANKGNFFDFSNDIPLDTWEYPKYTVPSASASPMYYNSVSVPMTPGSTAVTLLDHSNHLGNTNIYDAFSQNNLAGPDLSLYYAKKRELGNDGFHSSNSKQGYRRNDKAMARRDRIRSGSPTVNKRSGLERSYSPFNGMNYIIHVREKPRNK